MIARPISEYHEDMGDVLWWKFPITEAPYVGSPNDCGFMVQVNFDVHLRTYADPEGEEKNFVASRNVGGWPGYHTHFTPIEVPEAPSSAQGETAKLSEQGQWALTELQRKEVLSGCTSYVQRKLQVGYNRACNILEELERAGWITEPDDTALRHWKRSPQGSAGS